MERFVDFFTKNLSFGGLSFNLKLFLIFLLVFFTARLTLRLFKRIVSRNFTTERKGKFKPIFGFLNYSIYTIIILLALQNMGVELTAIFAASAALLVGIGFALQTFFQDIISGVFILIDQSVHV
ncbi:MAG: mechanosensitive ion channel protein MscS, partial [Flavobacteriaceae bacterium]